MAIFIDFSPIIISSVNMGDKQFGQDLTPEIIRHLALTMILNLKKQFSHKYGKVIICIDSGNVWRKDYFPHYKFSRRKARDESPLDWDMIYKSIESITQEMKDYLPYHVIDVPRCEADDIIGVLVEYFNHNELVESLLDTEPQHSIIISRDKDFKQLHRANVVQWDPSKKVWLRENSPSDFLIEQIIRGDAADGVPNMLSQDDSFVMKVRQKAVRQTLVEDVLKNGVPKENLEFYNRNKQLVDLSMIPEKYREQIITTYKEYKPQPKSKLLTYVVDKQLKNLHEHIQYF